MATITIQDWHCCKAVRMIEITCGIYKEPRVMVEDISALGLRSAAKTGDLWTTWVH